MGRLRAVGWRVSEGTLTSTRWVAGGVAESIFQPEWSPEGVLYFASDRNGWWNLQRISAEGEIESVRKSKAELGMPQWLFGMSLYAFASPELIICSHVEQGVSRLETIDLQTGKLTIVDSPFTDIQFLKAANGQAVFRAGSPTEVASITKFDVATGQFETLRRANQQEVYPQYFRAARDRVSDRSGTDGARFLLSAAEPRLSRAGRREAAADREESWWTNGRCVDRASLSVQFWTSRGFAVLDVNYGGAPATAVSIANV